MAERRGASILRPLRLSSPCGHLRLDPNTHALVYGWAFLTSLSFAIFAMNLIALILERVLG
jgi:hypothetical protein